MRILGLTGDIACGKSTVAQMLVEHGAKHLDSDMLVRELYADPQFAERLAALFGEVLDDLGGIDRTKLAPLVLSSPEKLLELERIVHPAVAALRVQKLDAFRAQGVKAVVIEAVKLLESGQGAGCDALWCVVCDPDVQVARLTQNRGFSPEEAALRLRNQPSHSEKMTLAGEVPLVFLPNNGTREELEMRVALEWKQFCTKELF